MTVWGNVLICHNAKYLNNFYIMSDFSSDFWLKFDADIHYCSKGVLKRNYYC